MLGSLCSSCCAAKRSTYALVAEMEGLVPALGRNETVDRLGTTRPGETRVIRIRAQQLGKIPRIGFLAAVPLATLAPRIQAFRRGLRELGYGPARSHLCGQDPQGNETRRAAGRAADEVRAGHQSEDRQGARPNDSAIAVATRGRGDPMTARFRVVPAAVQGDLIL